MSRCRWDLVHGMTPGQPQHTVTGPPCSLWAAWLRATRLQCSFCPHRPPLSGKISLKIQATEIRHVAPPPDPVICWPELQHYPNRGVDLWPQRPESTPVLAGSTGREPPLRWASPFLSLLPLLIPPDRKTHSGSSASRPLTSTPRRGHLDFTNASRLLTLHGLLHGAFWPHLILFFSCHQSLDPRPPSLRLLPGPACQS